MLQDWVFYLIPVHSCSKAFVISIFRCRFDTMATAPSPVIRKVSTVRSRFGLQPEAPLDEDHQDLEHHDLVWSRIRLTMREPFAEFFGTFIMVLFGDGSVAQVYTSISLDQQ